MKLELKNTNKQYIYPELLFYCRDVEFALPHDYYTEHAALYIKIAEVYREYNHMPCTEETRILCGMLNGKPMPSSLYKIKG